MRVFRPISVATLGVLTLFTVCLGAGFQILLVSVESWGQAFFGLSHSYFVVLALLTALGVISGTWLSLPYLVEPLSSPYRILWRAWPEAARRRVIIAGIQQTFLVTFPTLLGSLLAFGVLYLINPGAAPLLPGLTTMIACWLLVVCGVWCSLLVGIWAGKPAMGLLASVIVGLLLPNGFANSVPGAAGLVLLISSVTFLIGVFILTLMFWKWFRGCEQTKSTLNATTCLNRY